MTLSVLRTRRLLLLASFFATGGMLNVAWAQPSAMSTLTPPANGPRRADSTWFAIADCTVHAKPGSLPVRGTVVVKDGRIQAILLAQPGPDGLLNTADDLPARVPVGPAIIDAQGLHLYPAFVDPYVKVETPAPLVVPSLAHWNNAVTPSRSALGGAGMTEDRASKLRGQGFGAAGIAPDGGIIAGQSAVVSLAKPAGDASAARTLVYRDEVYQRISLETSRGGYPDSLMGAIAIVRQSFSDADWLDGLPKTPASADRQLNEEAVRELAKSDEGEPQLFVIEASNELNVLRAAKIAKEFDRKSIIVGSGMEFARLDAIKATGLSFILPLAFPKAPDVGSPEKADDTELRTMMTWEQAPTNPRRLAKAGVQYAFTTTRLRDVGDMTKSVRDAILHGLSPEAAFASLTTIPADMLGVASQLGTIEEGKRANLQLLTGPLFDLEAKDSKLRAMYVDGILHEISKPSIPVDGVWELAVASKGEHAGKLLRLSLEGSKATLIVGEDEPEADAVQAADKPAEKPADEPRKKKSIKLNARKVETNERYVSFVVDASALERALAGEEVPQDKPATQDAPAAAALVSLVFEDTREPQTVTGQVWLPSDRELALAGTRSVRSLEGVWPLSQVMIGAPGFENAVLRVKGDGSVVLFSPFETKVEGDVASNWEENELTVTLPGVALADATLRLIPRWNDEPLSAVVLAERGGKRLQAVVGKREANPFAGTWRVVSMDGKAIDAGATEQVRVTIDKDVKKESIAVSRTVPKIAEQDKPAQANETTKHTAKSKEAKLSGGTLTFSHTLKDIGFDSPLVSNDTLTLRFASDAPSTLALSSKQRDKLSKQKDRIEGVSTLTDTNKPDEPATKHTYVLEREDDESGSETKAPKDIPETLGLPFGPFAIDAPVQARLTLLVNGTLWTNTAVADENDIVPVGTLVLRDGKVDRILTHAPGMTFADALAAARTATGAGDDALVIDCTAKHITPGLIDAHSHTGISQGVNEGGQAITSEVRIQDVTNPDDVNWYRQLAGGITSVLSLHGSANAIGGQSQVNKLRWGCQSPDEMHFEGAIAGIKFALGENPRQVNWDRASDRYPKTRMGVETLIRDRFTAAREYALARKRDPLATRRDLELDALVEILDGKRLIHCHSYRQDEIVMLTHVAREFGFKIGTFQHILEGYKVADYVRDFSGGGSGFTDWWAFKQEVQDAIPAGLPLMQKVGATTSFNSDSNALARFMNVEAAKAVRYGREVGGFTEAQALRFVTLHPAMQLRVDDRVGKLKTGYQGDVVVWTRSPLSTFSLVEATFVDGKLLFSREQDALARKKIAAERDRLIAKLLEDPEAKKAREKQAKGKQTNDPTGATESDVTTGSSETTDSSLQDLGLTKEQATHLRELYLRSLTSGRVPTDAPGLCGCGLPHEAWGQMK